MLDIILLLIIFAYMFEGWRNGLSLSAFNIIGYILSIIISSKFSQKLLIFLILNTNILMFLEEKLTKWIKGVKNEYILRLFDGLDMTVFSQTLISVFGFIIIFFIISKIIGQIVKRINKFVSFDLLYIVDRLVGSVFGLVRGMIMIFILLALLVQLIEVDKNYVLEQSIYSTHIVKNLYKNNPMINVSD